MKKIIGTVIVLLVSWTLNAQINGTIRWERGSDFTLQLNNSYTEIGTETEYITTVGMPQIPFCTKTFLIPVNAEVSLRIESVRKNLITKDIMLYPVQPRVPIGFDMVNDWVEPNSTVYNSSNPFPGKYAEIISDREDFGYHLVTVRFYPLEYIPKKKELYSCEISFSLIYSAAKSLFSAHTVKNQSEVLKRLDRDYIRSIVDNKEMLDNFFPNIKQPASFASDRSSISSLEYKLPEYLIITNENLKSAFQLLADWKTKKGVPTIIETVENIVISYPGSDLQEKIRNYLIYMRRNYGSLFVLLGGDTNIIPARVKKSRDDKSKDWVAVDFYYACVENGNFDGNRNNIFFESGDYSESEDLGWSFRLGRAPVENLSEAEIFVNKIIHYEKADMNIDYSYMKNSMAADAFIKKKEDNKGSLSDSGRKNIANYYNNTGLNRWLIYDHYNCNNNTSVCSGRHNNDIYIDTSNKGEELNKINFIAALQDGGNSGLNHFHLIYHMDHSSAGSMGTSSKDKNESVSNWDIDNLHNGYYYNILMSGGCSPADITKDCIVEHFLTNSNGGAVAVFGNTDSGYSNEHKTFDIFLKELFAQSSGFINRYSLAVLHQKIMDDYFRKNSRFIINALYKGG